MAEYGEVFDFFEKQCLPVWQRSIVPLYKTSSQSGRPPEFVGSSVYCQFGRSVLLLTAGHVLKDILPGPVIYPVLFSAERGEPGSRGPMPSGAAEMRGIPVEKYGFPKDEGDDSGIIQLKETLTAWMPLAFEAFGQFDERAEYQHVLVGYPGSSTKGSNFDEQTIRIMGYLTNGASAEGYAAARADPRRQLLVVFKRQKVYGKDQARVTFPDPHGMSGGAVLQFHEKSPRVQSLVGILTDWQGETIVATRIEAITKHFRAVRVESGSEGALPSG